MDFNYDPQKSAINLAKHKISFPEATELWEGDIVEQPVTAHGESRAVVIGRISGTYWTAAITYRKNVIRIISVRKSTAKERSTYDRERNRR